MAYFQNHQFDLDHHCWKWSPKTNNSEKLICRSNIDLVYFGNVIYLKK